MLEPLPVTRLEGVQTRLLWAKRHHFVAGERHFTQHVPVYALWLVLEGELEVSSDQGRWKVGEGQVFLGVPCRQRLVVAQGDAVWLSVGLRVATHQGLDLLEREVGGVTSFEPSELAQLEALLSTLVAVEDGGGMGRVLMRDGLSLAVVGWYFSTHRTAETSWLATGPDHPLWLQETLKHIEQTPSVSVEELAMQAHFSAAQFRRLFAKNLGTSPRLYLRQRRLELARLWLETSDEPLGLIAQKTGWGNGPHFSRAFKEHFGVSPLEWRRASRTSL